MHILWVKMGGLWPSTTGGRVRSLQILSQLSRRHDVTLVTTHGPDDDPAGLAQHLSQCRQVVSLPYRVPKRGDSAFPLAVARSWLSSYPVDLWKWRVADVRQRVSALVAAADVDVCVADFLFAADNVKPAGQVPVVLFEHNVEYLIWQRLASVEQRLWRKALFEFEWRKLRRREAAALEDAHLTVAVSEEDRTRLAALAPKARTAAIPTGVDVDYFKPTRGHEVPGRLVFTGSMDWHPNEDAVLYFIDTILPLIRAQVPDASFSIVGRNPTARVVERGRAAGIHVTGTVDDVRPHIDAAEVYVVPLRAGSGTRLKIFEALAMGKAVVSTTVGAEGLSVTPGTDIVLADAPHDFAAAVVTLLQDAERRRALGDAGRQLVESRYSWSHVAREFETCCQNAVVHYAQSRKTSNRRVDLPRTGSPRHAGPGVLAGRHDAPGWTDRHS